jgi:PleD family two-component response regulator
VRRLKESSRSKVKAQSEELVMTDRTGASPEGSIRFDFPAFNFELSAWNNIYAQKALVVDSDFFSSVSAGLLEKRGYQVRKAYDGKQGIAGLDDGPDILFADLVMPKVTGTRFLSRARKFNGTVPPSWPFPGTLSSRWTSWMTSVRIITLPRAPSTSWRSG